MAQLLIDETLVDGDHIYNVIAWSVPESDAYGEGIKYRFHYGKMDGETILRYDNSHRIHQRHTPAGVTVVDFPGLWIHYRRFRMEIEQL